MNESLSLALVIIPLLVMSLSVHEFAHALIADRLGDPTARMEGRLTLNPAAHWDPIGTTLLVVLIFIQTLGFNIMAFGWGKPVNIDPRHFKNHKLDFFKSAIAGPISNLVLVALFTLLIRFLIHTSINPTLIQTLAIAMQLNIFLAIFNLLPIPPLDGSRLLYILLPEETYAKIEENSQLLIMGFILLIFLFPEFLGSITSSIFHLLLS